MTGEEKQMINACRIMIIGSEEFLNYLRDELSLLGFNHILNITTLKEAETDEKREILIEYIGNGVSLAADASDIPIIYPFDFISSAGAIVLFPGDDRKWLDKPDVRIWAAEYMAGYSAFWKIPGCDRLHEALPAIKAGETSATAQKTAAYMCARIAANIAVGNPVKRYPKFYLKIE